MLLSLNLAWPELLPCGLTRLPVTAKVLLFPNLHSLSGPFAGLPSQLALLLLIEFYLLVKLRLNAKYSERKALFALSSAPLYLSA